MALRTPGQGRQRQGEDERGGSEQAAGGSVGGGHGAHCTGAGGAGRCPKLAVRGVAIWNESVGAEAPPTTALRPRRPALLWEGLQPRRGSIRSPRSRPRRPAARPRCMTQAPLRT
ncbi:DUF6053 domain-containing protein [Lysobacter enzymogenes]|uniref:DUF6053 domain-containing protein n=1 Tax=Lysobacter enzymogenes TaxID=69 RepID=UPI003D2F77B2